MNVSLIDKELFASLLRYGEVILPDYSFSVISEELPIEEALRVILRSGNPIEYPSQYIIVLYDCHDKSNILPISAVKELVATDADGRRLFASQFREDLIIQPERYKAVFQEYLDDDFQKAKIKKGIVSFRTLCGLEVADNYDDEVSIIYHGISNRIRYRHHFQLPAEERNEPYALMISYDRHAPYPRAWAGYFYDVIETFCYHRDPNLGYSETVIEGTGIYKLINALPKDASSKMINEAIKDEKFTQFCNEFFNKPGGYLVPYIFFILRDRFRVAESYSTQANLIQQIKNQFPEAFDTASTFVGGFFGYEKFYDDYYTALNLPILRSQKPFRLPEPVEPVPNKAKEAPEIVDSKPVEAKDAPAPEKGKAPEGKTPETPIPDADGAAEVKEAEGEGAQAATAPGEERAPENKPKTATEPPIEPQTLAEVGLDGTPLYRKLYMIIDSVLSKGKEKTGILSGLEKHKDNDDELLEIQALFIAKNDKRDIVKEKLGLDTYPTRSMNKIKEYFKSIDQV